MPSIEIFQRGDEHDMVWRLLDRVWAGMAANIATAERFGFAWNDVYTAFVRLESGRPIAHAAVTELEAVIAGHSCRLGGIHAVCTDPDHRGRGHCRAVLETVLAHCERRYETTVLYTRIPELYTKFGFRHVEESVFSAAVNIPIEPARLARRLCADRGEDRRLLARVVANRVPVSTVLGFAGGVDLLALNEIFACGDFRRLYYHEDLEVITVHETTGETLRLYDVVGSAIPTLHRLLARVPQPVRRVVTYFAPDRLVSDGCFEARPTPLDHLMVRGLFGEPRGRVSVPPTARC